MHGDFDDLRSHLEYIRYLASKGEREEAQKQALDLRLWLDAHPQDPKNLIFLLPEVDKLLGFLNGGPLIPFHRPERKFLMELPYHRNGFFHDGASRRGERDEMYKFMADEIDPLVVADLLAIFRGQARLILTPRYYNRTRAQMVGSRILESPYFDTYNSNPNMGRLGQALPEICDENGPNLFLLNRYYQKAPLLERAIQNVWTPDLSVTKRLAQTFVETWSGGVSRGYIDEQHPIMCSGMGRVFKEGAGVEPHRDKLHLVIPGCQEAYALTKQLSANVFLQSPLKGGELEIWLRELSDEEYDTLRLPDSYGLDRHKLPPPDLVIKPEAGSLIIFDASLPHAVRPVESGVFITWQWFVGPRGEDQPLWIWN